MAENTLHTVFQFSDKTLDPNHTGKYELSILLAEDGFSFLVFDPERNKYTALGSYETAQPAMVHRTELSAGLLRSFRSFFENHSYLSRNFLRTVITIENRLTTLIPAALYEAGHETDYLGFNHYLPPSSDFRADFLHDPDAYLVYTLPLEWAGYLSSSLPGARIRHASSCFIETVLAGSHGKENSETVYLHPRSRYFEMAFIKNGKLHFYNTFQYSTQEDFLYFVLFALEQLNLNPELIPVILAGEVEPQSPLHSILIQYIRHVSFAGRPEKKEYSYFFDEIPEHYFFNLLHTLPCGS